MRSSPQAARVRTPAYVDNDTAPTVSVIDTATCDGTEHSGCAQTTPAIHVGAGGNSIDLDPAPHTAYVANGNDNTVHVADEVDNTVSVLTAVP